MLELAGETIEYSEYADLINQVNCNKKVLWNQGNFSGYLNNFTCGSTTVFNSAGGATDIMSNADDYSNYGQYTENEEQDMGTNTVKCYHGEYDYHMYSSTMGKDPDGNDNYDNGIGFITADDNSDNYITVYEAYDWENTEKSIIMVGAHTV